MNVRQQQQYGRTVCGRVRCRAAASRGAAAAAAAAAAPPISGAQSPAKLIGLINYFMAAAEDRRKPIR